MASKSIDWDEVLVTKDPKKKEVSVSFKAIDGFKPEVISPESLCVQLLSDEVFTHVTGSAHWIFAKLDSVPDRYVKVKLDFTSGNGIEVPTTPQYLEWYPGDDQVKRLDLVAGAADPQVTQSSYVAAASIDGSSCPVSQVTVNFEGDVVPPPEPPPETDPFPDDGNTGGEPLPGDNSECGPTGCDVWTNALADPDEDVTGVITMRVAADPAFQINYVEERELLVSQTSIGYRLLHPDGTESDFVSQRDNNPFPDFGATDQNIQDAITLNNDCLTGANVFPIQERVCTGRHWEGPLGSRLPNAAEVRTMSDRVSGQIALGRIEWPFFSAIQYVTRQTLTDYIFVLGSAGSPGGRYVDYRSEANFTFTGCTVEDRPINGDTTPYFPAGINARSTIRFQQLTSGKTGDFKIQRFNKSNNQYEDCSPDGFLKGGDFIKIKHSKECQIGWASSMPVPSPANVVGVTDITTWQIVNLTTNEDFTFTDRGSYTQGNINAWTYCIPSHPAWATGSGVLYGWSPTGAGASAFRIAITDDDKSAALIERQISKNYLQPAHCTRIP